MKKLLFIFTGGTIGSTIRGSYISTDSKKPYLLIEGYEKRYGKIENYETISPYTILSENMDEEYLIKLLLVVKENVEKYEGIIVTHGTDTLAYSSAALGYAFGSCKIPICIVSANYPLEDKRSNGYENLYGAIKFIENIGKGGVWVSYKNDNEPLKIHLGTKLLAQSSFSDKVSSVKNCSFAALTENNTFEININYKELPDEILPFLDNLNIGEKKLIAEAKKGFSRIMKITPYTGMYYPEIPENVKYILSESYHSGTINTVSERALDFYESAKKKGVKIYLTGVEERVFYESTKVFSRHGIIPIFNISPVAALVKLQLLSTFGRDVEIEATKTLSNDL